MSAYYNEHDPFAAAWLRELIADGLIAPGEVDERSIEDVVPNDLAGFVQCHFFAGIGTWSLALRQAGWPDDASIWTGSCPCQPFSDAGKGGGFDDERHLWPAFHYLVEQCGPDVVVGEQVASKDGLAWLDLVQADLEATGYAFGAVDTCAAGFGAPHIRQRLYWLADAAHRYGRSGVGAAQAGSRSHSERGRGLAGRRATGGLADGFGARLEGQPWHGNDGHQPGRLDALSARSVAESGLAGGVADVTSGGRREQRGAVVEGDVRHLDGRRGPSGARPGPTNGLWRDADWLCCTDGKWRPVEPDTFPLVDGGTVRNRVGLLRGAGNAINLSQATGFVEAVIDCLSVRTERQAA